jgi:hypothetical protein
VQSLKEPKSPIFVFALFLLTAVTVKADTITITGVDSGGFSTATVVCEFNAQTNTFTFTITNTSAITTPGSTSTRVSVPSELMAARYRGGTR